MKSNLNQKLSIGKYTCPNRVHNFLSINNTKSNKLNTPSYNKKAIKKTKNTMAKILISKKSFGDQIGYENEAGIHKDGAFISKQPQTMPNQINMTSMNIPNFYLLESMKSSESSNISHRKDSYSKILKSTKQVVSPLDNLISTPLDENINPDAHLCNTTMIIKTNGAMTIQINTIVPSSKINQNSIFSNGDYHTHRRSDANKANSGKIIDGQKIPNQAIQLNLEEFNRVKKVEYDDRNNITGDSSWNFEAHYKNSKTRSKRIKRDHKDQEETISIKKIKPSPIIGHDKNLLSNDIDYDGFILSEKKHLSHQKLISRHFSSPPLFLTHYNSFQNDIMNNSNTLSMNDIFCDESPILLRENPSYSGHNSKNIANIEYLHIEKANYSIGSNNFMKTGNSNTNSIVNSMTHYVLNENHAKKSINRTTTTDLHRAYNNKFDFMSHEEYKSNSLVNLPIRISEDNNHLQQINEKSDFFAKSNENKLDLHYIFADDAALECEETLCDNTTSSNTFNSDCYKSNSTIFMGCELHCDEILELNNDNNKAKPSIFDIKSQSSHKSPNNLQLNRSDTKFKIGFQYPKDNINDEFFSMRRLINHKEIKNEILDEEEELKMFCENEHSNLTHEVYQQLLQKDSDKDYQIDPHYLNNSQKAINWLMRAILIEWMMEVCSEFYIARETFFNAVNYVDRYISSKSIIEKTSLQLIGVSALFLASKTEEVTPYRLKDFAKSADDIYNTEQIIDMEIDILKTLKWKLHPQTIYNWTNFYMVEWDRFIDEQYTRLSKLFFENHPNKPYFKQLTEESFMIFRQLTQYVDCIILHCETLQYQYRPLVASFMYLVLGKYYGMFSDEMILNDMAYKSAFLYQDFEGYNQMFSIFLNQSFGFELHELLPTIQYCSLYFGLPINYELSIGAACDSNYINRNYEEFLSYQAYSKDNLAYVKKLGRNLNI